LALGALPSLLIVFKQTAKQPRTKSPTSLIHRFKHKNSGEQFALTKAIESVFDSRNEFQLLVKQQYVNGMDF
jgi:hypothetical protein